jgi:hypothetical protein
VGGRGKKKISDGIKAETDLFIRLAEEKRNETNRTIPNDSQERGINMRLLHGLRVLYICAAINFFSSFYLRFEGKSFIWFKQKTVGTGMRKWRAKDARIERTGRRPDLGRR